MVEKPVIYIQTLLQRVLVCPRSHLPLQWKNGSLTASNGTTYASINGIPICLLEEAKPTFRVAGKSLAYAGGSIDDDPPGFYVEAVPVSETQRKALVELIRAGGWTIDPVVSLSIAGTNGIAYKRLVGRLSEYPIPNIPLPESNGGRLLDIGCNWGRWSVAAARKGYQVVGVDPCLGAVAAAARVSSQLGVSAEFVAGDARHLPFKDESFDVVFSYSVLQHFSREDVKKTVSEIRRVLKPGGKSLIQMPNQWGVRCLYHQFKRGFKEPTGFDVRYWTVQGLAAEFSRIGGTKFFIDCFFGLGLQASDAHLMPFIPRTATHVSEFLKKISRYVPPMLYAADSVFVESVKPK